MKISLIVKTGSLVEIYGLNGTESLEYVHYNNLWYGTFDGLKRVYDESETMKRYMTRMVARYNFSGWNIK